MIQKTDELTAEEYALLEAARLAELENKTVTVKTRAHYRPKITTPKQKKYAELMVQNALNGQPKTKKEIAIEAGYSEHASPSTIEKADGVRTYLDKHGLNETTFAQYLADDLEAKPGNRLGELQLLSKVLGLEKQTIDLQTTKVDESLDLIRKLISHTNED